MGSWVIEISRGIMELLNLLTDAHSPLKYEFTYEFGSFYRLLKLNLIKKKSRISMKIFQNIAFNNGTYFKHSTLVLSFSIFLCKEITITEIKENYEKKNCFLFLLIFLKLNVFSGINSVSSC